MASSSAVSSICSFLLLVGACSGSVIPITGTIGHPGYYVQSNGLSTSYVAGPVSAGPVLTHSHVIAAAPVVPVVPAGLLVPSSPVVPSAPVVATIGKAAPAPGSVSLREPAPVEESPKPEEPAPSTEAAPEEPSTASPTPVSEPPKVEPAPVNPYLPVQDTPEVAAARALHLAAYQETQARDAAIGTEGPSSEEPTETPEAPLPSEAPTSPAAEASPSTEVPSALLPAAQPLVRVAGPLPAVPVAPIAPVAAIAGPGLARVASLAAPSVAVITAPASPIAVAPIAVAPIAVAPAVAVADASQYRVQDELGQYAFGHAGGPNAREEIKTADGITRGGYAYVDGNGLVQNARYVSDPVNGFRVAATNLPVQPAPAYLADTQEVAEAKAALFKAQEEHIAKL